MGTKRHPKSWWAKVVEEFECGDEDRQTFCARKRLNLGSFEGWLYRFRRAREATALVPVVVSKRASNPMPVEVDVRGGVTIRFAAGTDAAYVGTLVAELAGRC